MRADVLWHRFPGPKQLEAMEAEGTWLVLSASACYEDWSHCMSHVNQSTCVRSTTLDALVPALAMAGSCHDLSPNCLLLRFSTSVWSSYNSHCGRPSWITLQWARLVLKTFWLFWGRTTTFSGNHINPHNNFVDYTIYYIVHVNNTHQDATQNIWCVQSNAVPDAHLENYTQKFPLTISEQLKLAWIQAIGDDEIFWIQQLLVGFKDTTGGHHRHHLSSSALKAGNVLVKILGFTKSRNRVEMKSMTNLWQRQATC